MGESARRGGAYDTVSLDDVWRMFARSLMYSKVVFHSSTVCFLPSRFFSWYHRLSSASWIPCPTGPVFVIAIFFARGETWRGGGHGGGS